MTLRLLGLLTLLLASLSLGPMSQARAACARPRGGATGGGQPFGRLGLVLAAQGRDVALAAEEAAFERRAADCGSECAA